MIPKSGFLSIAFTIIVIVLVIWSCYTLVNPIAFLFLSAITFSIFYFINVFSFNNSSNEFPKNIERKALHAKLLSLSLLIILFFISIRVIHDYQLPNEERPYYSNADHYAIKNTAIAFTKKLELFSKEDSSENGIWPTNEGNLNVIANDNNVELQFRDFYKPVFGIHKKSKDSSFTYLINPLFNSAFESGFKISDSANSLVFDEVTINDNYVFYKFRKKPITYNFKLIFTSTDPEILPNGYQIISDTLVFENITLNRGLDVRDLIYKDSDTTNTKNSLSLLKWLNDFKSIQILSSSTINGQKKLHFFASEDVFSSNVRFSIKGRNILPILNYQSTFDISDYFFVGLGNNKDTFSIAQANSEKLLSSLNYTHILKLAKFQYHHLLEFDNNPRLIGNEEIRFIKNSYSDIKEFKIRDGIILQDGLNQNAFTKFNNTYLKFIIDKPTAPLNWKVWANKDDYITKLDSNEFLLKSENKKVAWIYSFINLSENAYSFGHLQVYLGLMMFFIFALVMLVPGKSVLAIETPILILVFSLMVFRLLLLWRVATFPPLDGITNAEYNTLQYFDTKIFGKNLPIPFSVFLFLFIIILIISYRLSFFEKLNQLNPKLYNYILSTYNSFKYKVPKGLYLHIIILFIGVIFTLISKQEFLERIIKILLPIISYFSFVYFYAKTPKKYNYDDLKRKKLGRIWISRLIINWVETPVFFLSLSTFFYLIYSDKGFAVLFLVFLVVKNVLLNFSRPPQQNTNRLFQPENFWIYGLISFVVFVLLITVKSLTHIIIENRRLIIIIIIGMTVFAIHLLIIKQSLLKRIFIGILLLFVVGFSINPIWEKVDVKIESQIKNVKYRATMIFQPLNKILLNQKYQSGAEKKIIETAQSQWFIFSYLRNTDFFVNKIDIQPHFKKGVDFSTQTRDVVLPRYVLSEFGGFVMLLLIIMLSLPLVLYFISYRIQNNGVLDSNSLTSVLSLILLFTISLIVWMSSTNRFVFFGQDFPFLSLTSRISCLIPLIIVFIVLTSSPLPRLNKSKSIIQAIRLPFYFIVIGIIIGFAGKSKILNEENFKPDFSDVERRLNNTINDYFIDAQNTSQIITDSNSQDYNHQKLYKQIGDCIQAFRQNPEYQKYEKDSLSTYEVSMLNLLQANPARGFNQRNPIHIINNNDEFHFQFNQYFHFELPVYNNKNIWKGDVYETKSVESNLNAINNAHIVVVPSNYLEPNHTSFALIDVIGHKEEVDLYNIKNKKLEKVQDSDFVKRLTDEDIVFYRDDKNKGFYTWSINESQKKYFEYNVNVNGKQRMVYPLGKDYYWIREWANTNKLEHEKYNINNLDSSEAINLDYNLTKSVSKYLKTTLINVSKNKETNSQKVIFSVIAADGDGRIRLMVDNAMTRTIIDPNNETEISNKLEDEYFFRNNEAARLQWGNTNLLHMKLGPGSSIKPLVLSAVASQRKLEWSQIKYIKISNFTKDPKNDKLFIIHKYAGLESARKSGLWKEEVSYNKSTILTEYLANSNNLYHSLIIFLGSYQKDDFDKTNSLKDKLTPLKDNSSFPILQIGDGINYTLSDSSNWPLNNATHKHFDNPKSMIAVGFTQNLGLQTYSTTYSGKLSEKNNFSKLNSELIYKNVWAFPERSYFDQNERGENFSNAIPNTTKGGGVFRLTPLQILEMYGKMFNYDTDYSLSIDSVTGSKREWQNVGSDWSGLFKEQFLKNQVFVGMSNVINNGTAKYLNEFKSKYPTYDFYAKTGTIGANKDDNSKRLIVVISKKGPNNIEQQKKYLVYFTIQNAYIDRGDDSIKGWFQKHITKVLGDIVNSETFKNYMQ